MLFESMGSRGNSLLICTHRLIWLGQIKLARKAFLRLHGLDELVAALVDVLCFGGRHGDVICLRNVVY